MDNWDCGFDSVIFGANETNCDFRLFSSRHRANIWGAGAKAARRLCKRYGRRWLQILFGVEGGEK